MKKIIGMGGAVIKTGAHNLLKENINDIEMFDLAGGSRIIVVDFSTQYIGTQQINYGQAGTHRFKILDDSGKYYNPQQTYLYCSYSDAFRLGVARSGYKTSGCLEFIVSDFNEPTKLVFYDDVIYTMCEIDLS